MADEVRAQISDQELRDLQAELEQARARIAELEGIIVEILEDSRGSPPDGSPIMIDQGLLAHAAKLVKWGLYALKEPADG
jgi:hypothetical protein